MATVVSALPRTTVTAGPLRLWHLLSLDAPCIAALWTCFLAHAFRVPLSHVVPLALALAVWLLYVGDRIYDAARGQATEERHHFHLRHRALLLGCAAMAAATLTVLLFQLPVSLRQAWIVLALPLAGYVCLVHGLRRRVAKEPLVAAFFAIATAMPVAVVAPKTWAHLLTAAFSFGALCWLNCAAIARWEWTLQEADACTARMGRHLAAGACGVAVCALPLLLRARGVPIACAVIMAAGLLLLLDRVRSRLEAVTLRALADAALLTPLIVWPLATLLQR